jgi:hypothetical protein
MAETVYILCMLTSIACAALLIRGYRRNQTRLLLWSGLCFISLAASNFLLVIDLMIVPGINLAPFRLGLTLVGLAMLIHGLIWETV